MNEQNTANFIPYEGDEPYIFVSYSHKDRERVFQIIHAINQAGYRLWFDVGIQWASDFSDTIAKHLSNCAVCLAFHSKDSVTESEYCRKEIHFALREKKPVHSIYLEDVKLPFGLALELSTYQYSKLFEHDSIEAFVSNMERMKVFAPCRSAWKCSDGILWSLDEFGTLKVAKETNSNIDRFPYEITSKDNILSLVIEDGIVGIGSGAFKECLNLKKIIIADSVSSIEANAFWGCVSLVDVHFPRNLISIGAGTFSHCESLTTIEIPNKVTQIETEAFRGCACLKGIKLSYNVTGIEDNTFRDCTNLGVSQKEGKIANKAPKA